MKREIYPKLFLKIDLCMVVQILIGIHHKNCFSLLKKCLPCCKSATPFESCDGTVIGIAQENLKKWNSLFWSKLEIGSFTNDINKFELLQHTAIRLELITWYNKPLVS